MGRHATSELDAPTAQIGQRVEGSPRNPAKAGWGSWPRHQLIAMIAVVVLAVILGLGSWIHSIVVARSQSNGDASSQVNDYTQTYGGVSYLSAREVRYFQRLDSLGVPEWRQDQAQYESDILHSVCEPLDEGTTPSEVAIELAGQKPYTLREAAAIVNVAVTIDCSSHEQQLTGGS